MVKKTFCVQNLWKYRLKLMTKYRPMLEIFPKKSVLQTKNKNIFNETGWKLKFLIFFLNE